MAFIPNKTVSGNEPAQVKEFPIATNTDLVLGAAVKLSSGKVVKATDNADILGVTALRHDDEVDMFAPQSGTAKVSVYFDPNQMFECPIGDVALSANSTAGEFKIAGTADPTQLDNLGYALYNGTKYAITAVAYSSSVNTFTATNFPASVASGTKIKIIPAIGNTQGSLTTNADGLTFADGVTSDFIVVEVINNDKVLVKATKHILK